MKNTPFNVVNTPGSRVRQTATTTSNSVQIHLQEASWVKARRVALYALWKLERNKLGNIPAHPNIWGRHIYVGLWPVTYLVWLPGHETVEPWLTPEQVGETFDALLGYLTNISPLYTDDAIDEKEPIKPAYLILQIEELRTEIPQSVQRKIRSNQRLRYKGKDAIRNSVIGAQEEVVDLLQHHLGIDKVDSRGNWAPTRFSHYNRNAGRRGWIVFAPKLTLMVGMDDEQARTLTELIQPHDISSKDEGLLPECYEAVHMRIMQWNATNDIFETVNHLENIVESSKKSTDGQVLLNFALATIGVLLTLFALPLLSSWQIASLLLLAGASVSFWLYARNGAILWQSLGLLLFATAVIVAFAPFWLIPLFHFLIGWITKIH